MNHLLLHFRLIWNLYWCPFMKPYIRQILLLLIVTLILMLLIAFVQMNHAFRFLITASLKLTVIFYYCKSVPKMHSMEHISGALHARYQGWQGKQVSKSVLASFIDCLCSYNESRKCVSDLENEQMPSSMIEGIMAINDIVYWNSWIWFHVETLFLV
jgi:hypothetical protein